MSELLGSLIKVSNLTKSYGRNRILHALCLEVNTGEIAVIHWNNGSGKTTLQMIISSLVPADLGSVEVCGLGVGSSRTRALIGFVAHSPFIYGPLTILENLSFFSKLCADNTASISSDRFRNLLHVLGLDSKLGERGDTLSHGFLKRGSIARALVNDPNVLLLDEPESGLDITTKEIFEEIILEFASKGGSVLLTTHDRTLKLGPRATYYTIENGNLK